MEDGGKSTDVVVKPKRNYRFKDKSCQTPDAMLFESFIDEVTLLMKQNKSLRSRHSLVKTVAADLDITQVKACLSTTGTDIENEVRPSVKSCTKLLVNMVVKEEPKIDDQVDPKRPKVVKQKKASVRKASVSLNSI